MGLIKRTSPLFSFIIPLQIPEPWIVRTWIHDIHRSLSSKSSIVSHYWFHIIKPRTVNQAICTKILSRRIALSECMTKKNGFRVMRAPATPPSVTSAHYPTISWGALGPKTTLKSEIMAEYPKYPIQKKSPLRKDAAQRFEKGMNRCEKIEKSTLWRCSASLRKGYNKSKARKVEKPAPWRC